MVTKAQTTQNKERARKSGRNRQNEPLSTRRSEKRGRRARLMLPPSHYLMSLIRQENTRLHQANEKIGRKDASEKHTSIVEIRSRKGKKPSGCVVTGKTRRISFNNWKDGVNGTAVCRDFNRISLQSSGTELIFGNAVEPWSSKLSETSEQGSSTSLRTIWPQ